VRGLRIRFNRLQGNLQLHQQMAEALQRWQMLRPEAAVCTRRDRDGVFARV
jgi:hypothetical protein